MKIFVVVGTLFAFDRLIGEMDKWAKKNPEVKIIAQIGKTGIAPENMTYHRKIEAKLFNEIYDQSDLIVSHAGMGVVLKALMINKPIVILPRKLELNEHTTDHQMATTKALDKKNLVHIAWELEDLMKFLEEPQKIKSKTTITEFAPEPIISNLSKYIASV